MMTSTAHDLSSSRHGEESGHALGHVVPPGTLVATFTALVVLTIVTVVASTLGLGAWEVWATLGIATLKGTLVAMYFMHLRYDRPFHALLAVFCLGFVFLFLGLILLDSQGYQPEVDALLDKLPVTP
jgi:cytochrome c oxidase subunit 4